VGWKSTIPPITITKFTVTIRRLRKIIDTPSSKTSSIVRAKGGYLPQSGKKINLLSVLLLQQYALPTSPGRDLTTHGADVFVRFLNAIKKVRNYCFSDMTFEKSTPAVRKPISLSASHVFVNTRTTRALGPSSPIQTSF